MSGKITTESFREIAIQRFKFLETKGFKRETSIEEVSPTVTTLVYLGENIGFVFSYDVRDQCFDSEVVKVTNRQIIRNNDGGYSSDIFTHLVRHQGYRGSPTGITRNKTKANRNGNGLVDMIEACINLLNSAGQTLLDDSLSSLPSGKKGKGVGDK